MDIAIVGGRPLLKKELCDTLINHSVAIRLDEPLPTELTFGGIVMDCDFQDVVSCENFLSGIDCLIYTGFNWRGYKEQEVYDQILDLGCIINEALNSHIKIIFISDVLSMGYHPSFDKYDESKVWNQSLEWSYSGYMYHLAEREVYRGISEGIEAVVVRPSYMFGEAHDKSFFLTNISNEIQFLDGEDGAVNIVSRKDLIQLIIQLIALVSYDHHFVNCTNHAISVKELQSNVIQNHRPKKSKLYSSWFERFGKKIISSAINRPIGLRIEYDNSRSIDWLGVQYSNIESTLDEFRM